jgi:3'-phosphoadenosine 5'-phosphosulfate sulfotransferase (PAPS reductase)/FAD synthetase
MKTIKLVSISGGKDSTATLLLALESHPHDEVMAAFADTGNEHESTYEYVDYLEQKTGVKIHRVKADFSDRWWNRIENIKKKWPDTLINPKPVLENPDYEEHGEEPVYFHPAPMTPDEAYAVVERAVSIMEKGPTGNPYLDLCIMRARFPSTRSAFCTSELKVIPITEYTLGLIDEFGAVESWQGVRAEESPRRANLPEREDKGGGLTIYRPIHKWLVDEVFAMHDKHGIEPNPLYKQGMTRVGCMPCINCNKGELLEISKRFPQHIERIAEWERIVGQVSKRGCSTFFPALGDTETAYERGNIFSKVEWSKTLRGGKKYDLFSIFEEPAACSSAYGLCE